MTEIYLNVAQKFISERKFSYAETALRKALGAANKEHLPTGNIFRSLNYVRGVM
jgi:hypothetical protein